MRLPAQLLHRRKNVHKGDFGHILILAGSRPFSGAGVLCSLAAMRSGAGLVTLGIPKSLANPLIKLKSAEVMLLPLPETKEGTLALCGYLTIKKFLTKANVLVVGPGLSQNKSTQALIRKIIASAPKPMIIDADGLNALKGKLGVLRSSANYSFPKILTPHAGEMNRLTKETPLVFARCYGIILVLKGHRTTVTGPGGRQYTNKTGNPGMATAGSGDVLSGIIAAFLGQGLCAFDAAKYGVYIHGSAGDLAAKEKTEISLIASDIIDKIPLALKATYR